MNYVPISNNILLTLNIPASTDLGGDRNENRYVL